MVEIGRFFRENSDFGGPGKDFAVEKSEKKKKIGDFSPIFPRKKPNFFFLIFFLTPKICKKLLLTGFEPTQNAWK